MSQLEACLGVIRDLGLRESGIARTISQTLLG
jgi:hypothetical protein